jgi:hypothetical protein
MALSLKVPARSRLLERAIVPESAESAESRESSAVSNVVPLTHANLAQGTSAQPRFAPIANHAPRVSSSCRKRCSRGPGSGHGFQRRKLGEAAGVTGRRSSNLFIIRFDSGRENPGRKPLRFDSSCCGVETLLRARVSPVPPRFASSGSKEVVAES